MKGRGGWECVGERGVGNRKKRKEKDAKKEEEWGNLGRGMGAGEGYML